MKTSLIIFGMIFLILGGLLYFVPMQEIKAGTTTIGDGDVNTRTSYARVTIPIEWTYASAIIGLVLLMFGLTIPEQMIRSNSKRDSYDKIIESKENIDVGDGKKHRIVRERTEKHTTRND